VLRLYERVSNAKWLLLTSARSAMRAMIMREIRGGGRKWPGEIVIRRHHGLLLIMHNFGDRGDWLHHAGFMPPPPLRRCRRRRPWP
jgi:hypothetical protein